MKYKDNVIVPTPKSTMTESAAHFSNWTFKLFILLRTCNNSSVPLSRQQREPRLHPEKLSRRLPGKLLCKKDKEAKLATVALQRRTCTHIYIKLLWTVIEHVPGGVT